MEFAPTLVSGKQFASVCRCIKRVPADQYRSGLFLLIEAQEDIGEAENGSSSLVAFPANGFWESVIRPMGERVSIDDKERWH